MGQAFASEKEKAADLNLALNRLSEKESALSDLQTLLEDAQEQLRSKESERQTLVSMNAEQAGKIEEDLIAIKRLQEREQELGKWANRT